VPVEVGHELGEEAVLLGDGDAVGRGVGHGGWLWLLSAHKKS
jgi:hypothetical protein